MPAPPTGLRGVLHRLIHVGVDPALPRRDTKHIVLTNALALFCRAILALSLAISELNSLRPEVRWALGLGVLGMPVVLALNAARRPLAAATCFLLANLALFLYIGVHEPSQTQHEAVVILLAAISFFVFPQRLRWASAVSSATCFLGILWLRATLAAGAPEQLPGFDAYAIGTSNLIVVLLTLTFLGHRATSEIDRVENELVEEKKKTEAILQREVAHQVAERSRELGNALSRTDGPASPSPASPTRFGSRYRVLHPLGEGGMGAVVEVERLTDGARLALKVMTGAVSREHAARFAREAEIGARIHHPNVVSIVDIGVAEGGAPFLVMELLPGGSLERQRARFGEPRWARPILRQMAEGLAALHEAGVVHRDLKPANVLLDTAGTAKLSDFGIARMGPIPIGAVDPDAATAAPAAGSALTATGAWVGTPLYMAPEAARGGREIGPAADLFAFGVVAYELLGGRLPFATPPVLLALVSQPVPVPPPLDGIDSRLSDLVLSCLAEAPAARPTASALRDALSA